MTSSPIASPIASAPLPGAVPPEREAAPDGARAPLFTTSLGRLYRGDCLEVLPEVADASIDLVFADPPFNAAGTPGRRTPCSRRNSSAPASLPRGPARPREGADGLPRLVAEELAWLDGVPER